VADILN
jgi:hypothetical protein